METRIYRLEQRQQSMDPQVLEEGIGVILLGVVAGGLDLCPLMGSLRRNQTFLYSSAGFLQLPGKVVVRACVLGCSTID